MDVYDPFLHKVSQKSICACKNKCCTSIVGQLGRVCTQELLNHFPLPTLAVFTDAQRLFNHSVYNCKWTYALTTLRQLLLRRAIACYCCDGVRLCLCVTAAGNGPIVHPPDDIWIWSSGWMILRGKTEELWEKPVPVPLCPPQIPHGLTLAQNRTSAVRSRRLTAWAMARPCPLPWWMDKGLASGPVSQRRGLTPS
jgi:hypothetical protein